MLRLGSRGHVVSVDGSYRVMVCCFRGSDGLNSSGFSRFVDAGAWQKCCLRLELRGLEVKA